MNIDPVIAFCIGMMAFAAINTWIVTRPFVRARREQRKAQTHAAE